MRIHAVEARAPGAALARTAVHGGARSPMMNLDPHRADGGHL